MRRIQMCGYCGRLKTNHTAGCTRPRCKECNCAPPGHSNLCSQGPNLLGEEALPKYIPPYFKNGFLQLDLGPINETRTRIDLARLLSGVIIYTAHEEAA